MTRKTAAVLPVLAAATIAGAQEKLHYTYLWHLEQPIYWPDQQTSGADRYELAWQSIQRTDGGAAHPANNLRDIFSWPDRVAAYQHRCRDSINAIRSKPEAGAQISYSGGLVENIMSLGAAGQLGYGSNWHSWLREARGWTTVGQSKPRADIVVFPFHHPLCPLIDESTLRKEIQLYKAIYDDAWGSSAPVSRGIFPSEMAFSTRMIQVLAEEDIAWAFVSGEKLSRACADFPVVLGTGGVNCDPPNKADQLNGAQGSYYRVQISRGCSPAEAYPFAFTPHRAQHVDPDTGQVHSIIVVPCAQAIGWEDGYAAIGTGHFDAIQPLNNPSRPMLAVLAHDGDNNWGGGYSYYMEATPNLANSASAAGYIPTTVEEYLADHPVPGSDVVHVEDGAWVNADGDFGSPQFLNWNWPPVNAQGDVDIPAGWAEDIRNWAVITAAQNHVDTAEQISTQQGLPVRIDHVLSPGASTRPAERAWHYFLGSLNSGYMYYGTSLDFEVKPTIACNEALQHAAAAIGDGSLDQTGPSIWIPQRHPWNPGALNFGPQYGYQQHNASTDFRVWTFVHDLSGVSSVTLRYRVDADGANPLASIQNETYAGGPEVGPWQSIPMTFRDFPAGNFFNDPSISFFEMPQQIADQYHAQISGLSNALVDYYVEAIDSKGNVRRSPIQHVWVDDGQGDPGGGGDRVEITPDPAVAGQPVTITYNPTGGPLAGAPTVLLHYGFNNWSPVVSPDPAMSWDAIDQRWEITVPVQPSATQLDVVFNNGSGTWDNNGGQDWHFAVSGGQPTDQWDMDGLRDTDSTLIATNSGVSLWAGLKGTTLYVATNDAGEGSDHFILLAHPPGSLRSAMWAKAGQVANWSAFLADENNNDYEGWFDAQGAVQAATGANGGVLEGTIDLFGEFGSLPETVHLAVALYATNDGGTLLSTHQVPASINGDGNVDGAEFVEVRLCELTDTCCPADTTGDGTLNTDDFIAYLVLYASGDPGADVDGTPGVNTDDFITYLGLFATGC